MDHYKSKSLSIVQALNDIEKFLDKLDGVQRTNPDYMYEPIIKLNYLGETFPPFKWEVDLKLYKHEL